jgi:ABC-2 type transport system permease protein
MRQTVRSIWVVARRELTVRAGSKAFRISTAVMMISLILGIVVPARVLRDADQYTVAVVAGAGDVSAAISEQAVPAGLSVDIRPVGDRAGAVALVQAGTVDAAVVDLDEIIWKSGADGDLEPVLRAAVSQTAIARRVAAAGVDPATLVAPAGPTVTVLSPRPDRTPQTIIALIGMILLFVALNFYGSYVLMGVVEEKSSRVVEVLLARVPASHLLAGKVVGIGLLGIGQFVTLGVVAAVTLQIVRPPELPPTTLPMIAGIVVWFILGYVFYSVLYGALGALASRMEDAQTAVAPLTGFLLLAYFGAFAILGNPHAWWVTVGSLLPPTAPMFMPVRAALTTVPAWQMVAAVVSMLAAIVLLVQAGGRLYRGAVLHTGGRIKIRQAWTGTTGAPLAG